MATSDLEKRAAAARQRADVAAEKAVEARTLARAAAEEAVELEQELERERWVDVQVAAGHPVETIDVDRGIVTTLPVGPVYE